MTASVVTPFCCGLWAMGVRGGRWCAMSRGSGRGSSRSRPCCGGGLGSATRRRCDRHRGPLTGRPARQPLALALGPRPNSVCLALNGVIPKSPRRDSSPGVTSSRGGGGVARAHHGRVGAHRGLGCGTTSPAWLVRGRCIAPYGLLPPSPARGVGPLSGPLWRARRCRAAFRHSPPQQGREGDPTLRPGRSHAPSPSKAERPRAHSPGPHAPRSSRAKSLTRPPRPCTRRPKAVQRHRRPRRAP